MIKSPLRYPGGKSRAIKVILPLITEFDEEGEKVTLSDGSKVKGMLKVYHQTPSGNILVDVKGVTLMNGLYKVGTTDDDATPNKKTTSLVKQ